LFFAGAVAEATAAVTRTRRAADASEVFFIVFLP
jgi:hypothetical protein